MDLEQKQVWCVPVNLLVIVMEVKHDSLEFLARGGLRSCAPGTRKATEGRVSAPRIIHASNQFAQAKAGTAAWTPSKSTAIFWDHVQIRTLESQSACNLPPLSHSDSFAQLRDLNMAEEEVKHVKPRYTVIVTGLLISDGQKHRRKTDYIQTLPSLTCNPTYQTIEVQLSDRPFPTDIDNTRKDGFPPTISHRIMFNRITRGSCSPSSE